MKLRAFAFWTLTGLVMTLIAGAGCMSRPAETTDDMSKLQESTATSTLSAGVSPLVSPLPTAMPPGKAVAPPALVTAVPSGQSRPPAIEVYATPPPAETARADLAHRLHTDIALIQIVQVITREPDADEMPCLAEQSMSQKLWADLNEVQWISLSVKGNIHYYAAMGDLILYCEK